MKKHQANKVILDHEEIDPYKILIEDGQPLTPEDLFIRASLQADDHMESVEMFYEVLGRAIAAGSIVETRPVPDSILLEAVK